MKIVFLSDDFPPTSFGGAGISTYELAVGMKNAGHEVSVISACRKKSDEGKIEYHGLTIFKIASDYNPRWRAFMSVYNRPAVVQVDRILRQIRPDVVHVNNIHFYLSYHCFKIAKEHARVVVFTARDTMSVCYGKLRTDRYLKDLDGRTTWRDHIQQIGKRYNPIRNFCIRRYFGYADKLCAVSNALKNALEQNGIPHVGVVHTGADVRQWGATEDEKNTFREKYNLTNKKVIFFGGRLSEGKGGMKSLEALVRICKDVPDAVLLVAGSIDEYAERMQREAVQMGVGDRLIITGWIERETVQIAYAVAHVVLVPSLYLDPFPRIAIEAMASGKPVVATCYGGAPEIVVDGVTGYVVNPLHPEEIAIKAIDLLKDSRKAEQFGEAGYERIKKDFNFEDKIREYEAIYRGILTADR